MDNRKFYSAIPKQIVAGGSALLAGGEACQRVVQSQAKLSRSQLARLLTIPEGDRKQKVREILKDPYCELSNLQIRAGAPAQREAYPMEFDPQTWLVILYEGDQYAGYRINAR
jgi:hypothetical protein